MNRRDFLKTAGLGAAALALAGKLPALVRLQVRRVREVRVLSRHTLSGL